MQARFITALFLGVALRVSLSYTDLPAVVQAYHGSLGPSLPLKQLFQPQHHLRERAGMGDQLKTSTDRQGSDAQLQST